MRENTWKYAGTEGPRKMFAISRSGACERLLRAERRRRRPKCKMCSGTKAIWISESDVTQSG